MKFTAKEEFRHGHTTFETGNTYDSAKHGLTDAEVMSFHANGWAEVEGKDPAPARQVIGAQLNPHSAKHALVSTEG